MASFRFRNAALSTVLLAWISLPSLAQTPQQVQGFALERFYPSAPGGGWFVMDDLNLSGGLGGAVSLTGGYARNPLEVNGPGGQRLAVVSGEAFVEVGVAATYDRYRLYLNFPTPVNITGNSGTLGPYQLSAPSLSVGTGPDYVTDPVMGFDARLFGKPKSRLRLGVGGQLIFPSGARSDYVTDARYRGMVRMLAAGDYGKFSYAGQFGVHIRPLNDSPVPNFPNGNELLFGVSAGRRLMVRNGWAIILGPEFFGETAVHSLSNDETGFEGLLTGRLEGTGDGRHLRAKVGIGHGIVQHFGAPEWRVLFGVEVFASATDKHRRP
jgi:hypothetical protein